MKKVCIICRYIEEGGKWRKPTSQEKEIYKKIEEDEQGLCLDCGAIIHAPTNMPLNLL